MLIDFRELFPKYGIAPKGVLHIGANVGEEAPIYLELGIKKQIWIEANPEIFLKLKENISNNPEAVAFNYCVSDKNEKVTFNISNNGSQSSSILELGTHLIAHPEVNYVKSIEMKSVRIESVFSTFDGCDFLNLDLQGAELKALVGMEANLVSAYQNKYSLLNEFKWVYTEVNKEELYKGCALIGDLDAYLLHFGFERVETKWCGNTGWGDSLYIKK